MSKALNTEALREALAQRLRALAGIYFYFLVWFSLLIAISVFAVGPLFAFLKHGSWALPTWVTPTKFIIAPVLLAAITTSVIWLVTEVEIRRAKRPS